MKLLQFLSLITSIITILSCTNIKKDDSYDEKDIIISGKVKNSNPNNRKVRIIINRLGLESNRCYSELDDSGFYKIKFKSYIPGDVRITYENANFLVLTHPSDSIHVEFDNKEEINPLNGISFTGDAFKSNMEVIKFQKSLKQNEPDYNKIQNATKSLNYEEFKIYMDSINKRSLKVYEDFIKNENPCAEVKTWGFIYSQEQYYYFLGMYPRDHAEMNKLDNLSVPTSYYDFQLGLLPIKKKYCISTYQLSMYVNQFLFGYIKNKILEENREQIRLNPESINSDSLYVDGIIKHISDPLLRQLVLTERIRQNLDKKNLSIFEKYQDIIIKNITEPFLIDPLIEKYEIIKQQIERPKIASNAILRDLRGTEIATIIDSIISINQKKVIYIDCWGPWCAPCMKELPSSKQMMNQLKDKKIVFIYLCIDSDFPQWKATLTDLQLGGTHYFFDKNQSTSLRKSLEINGVPFYLLINKRGIIVDKGSHLRPSNPETLSKIEKLINE